MRPFSVGLLLALLTACNTGKPIEPRAATKDVVPVTIGTVERKTLPVELRVIGNVQAYSTVSIKAQISGQIMKVHFEQGQDVKQGDLLFTIDPRPFEAVLRQAEANLKQAEANLARDMAELKNGEAEAARYQQMFQSGIVAAEQYDRMRTNAETRRAAIQADQSAIDSLRAAVENARLQLEYTAIRAPMDGRTGNLIVNNGNLVKANENPALVVINQIRPIYVSFAVPAQHLDEIKRRMAAGKLKVEAIPKDGGRPVTGELTFIDNAIDVSTATIQLKGTFANENGLLWPGEYVDVVLTLATQPNAIVVPSQAIQNGQQGQYVFVVKPDLTVESRPGTVGRTRDQQTVVEKGVEAGERVVT
ncbi:MAG: efflux RND transporter periplasmic adaptor subunit, partial [Acidobacteria bacterium]|nr:efflux RND transporter periplasmic adaptor subunit [Acidobacteriota bacterium]